MLRGSLQWSRQESQNRGKPESHPSLVIVSRPAVVTPLCERLKVEPAKWKQTEGGEKVSEADSETT